VDARDERGHDESNIVSMYKIAIRSSLRRLTPQSILYREMLFDGARVKPGREIGINPGSEIQ
jgi:hypothetical protein